MEVEEEKKRIVSKNSEEIQVLKEMFTKQMGEMQKEKERIVGENSEEIQVLKEMFTNQMGEMQKEKERIVGENSKEIQVLKETFTKKMVEMQKDLLAMVEHCLNFENGLSQTKEENQKMKSQIKELVEERDRRMRQDKLLQKDVALEEAAHSKKSTVEEVANIKTPGVSSNKRMSVTVFSGSEGSTPNLSKPPPSTMNQAQVMPPSPRSTKGKIVWHHPAAAPLYPPGPSRLPVYHQGFSDQYQYDTTLYPLRPSQPSTPSARRMNHHQNLELNY